MVAGCDLTDKKTDFKALRAKVGMVFQYPEYQLFDETVEADISFGPKNIKLSDEEIKKRVKSASEFCGLSERDLKRSPFELSGGQKRRVAIAGVLAMMPEVLVLDEPAAGLDPVVRDELVEMLYDFTRDESHSILISSHIVSDLEKLCDYIAFLHGGKLMLCEEKDVLLSQYGILRCTEEELSDIPEDAVKHKKITPYGAEALVKRDLLPDTFSVSAVGLEELFVSMIKENK